MRQREKEMAIREMFANVAAMSKEGHDAFMNYIDSFERKLSWKQIKSSMSDAMLKFLGKAPNG